MASLDPCDHHVYSTKRHSVVIVNVVSCDVGKCLDSDSVLQFIPLYSNRLPLKGRGIQFTDHLWNLISPNLLNLPLVERYQTMVMGGQPLPRVYLCPQGSSATFLSADGRYFGIL